jgi:hypothetical protein
MTPPVPGCGTGRRVREEPPTNINPSLKSGHFMYHGSAGGCFFLYSGANAT